MINIMRDHVSIGVVQTPLTEYLSQLDNGSLLRAEMTSDLNYLFGVMFKEFGKADTAQIIEMALKDADNIEPIED